MIQTYTVEEVEKMLGEISPWPWKEDFMTCGSERGKAMGWVFDKNRVHFVCKELTSPCHEADMAFIAAAPEIISSLLVQLKSAREKLGVAEEALDLARTGKPESGLDKYVHGVVVRALAKIRGKG